MVAGVDDINKVKVMLKYSPLIGCSKSCSFGYRIRVLHFSMVTLL